MAGQKSNNVFDSKTYGNLKRIFANTCSTPFSLYVEAAVPAFVDAFISAVSPDLKEAYHMAFGEPFIHDARNAVKEALHLPGPTESKWVRFAYDFTGAFDLITWYAFLAAVVADGVTEWSSDVLEFGPCGPLTGKTGHGTLFGGAIPDQGRWGTLEFQFPAGPFSPVSGCSLVLESGTSGMIAFTGGFGSFNGLPVSSNSRISVQSSGRIIDQFAAKENSKGHLPKNVIWGRYDNPSGHGTDVLSLEFSTDNELPLGEAFPTHDCTLFLAKFNTVE